MYGEGGAPNRGLAASLFATLCSSYNRAAEDLASASSSSDNDMYTVAIIYYSLL